ncbi:hypothetical protein [Microvirga sp. G4-2]|uniref:hypothetical protein n=1 Tax=Microvirga sp. G4-2 TaxID=3434467 RepID=UPI004043A325
MGPIAIGYVHHEEEGALSKNFFPGEEQEIAQWLAQWQEDQKVLFCSIFYPGDRSKAELSYDSAENR